MPSGFNLRQKDISVGSGLNIEYSQTGAGILISAVDTTNTTVHIYDARVDAETGVITITDGTQVADLAIGDEIRTPDGVYQKIKDSITTGSPADGTRIEVSGITNPTDINGTFILQSENKWKHESKDYWIVNYYNNWCITDLEEPTSVITSYYYSIGEASDPWSVTRWAESQGSGNPVLENIGSSSTVTDTIDLFEYASLPVEPENIVQSVNGNKPDASGNVTIETSSGGLTSVATGDGLTGNGTAGDPITLDLSNYNVESDINLHTSGPHSIALSKGIHGITISDDITLKSLNTSIVLGVNITYNDNPQNTAGGLAVVESNGKLPSSIIPESTVDLSNYTGALNVTTTANASIRGGTSGNYDITIGDSSHGVTVYAAQNNPTVSITSFGSTGNIDLNSANINVGGSSGSTKITLKSSNVSVEPTTGGGTFSVDVTSSGSAKFTAGNIYFNNNASNTAGGFAIVGSDGKLPASIIPVSGNRHPFTSSDLSSNVLTITTTGNVTGVIDDSGKAWNFADEEVTYTDSTVSVDLSGVFARKGIATPTGTWKLMLYGA